MEGKWFLISELVGVNWLFHVTFNDISVIYVTTHIISKSCGTLTHNKRWITLSMKCISNYNENILFDQGLSQWFDTFVCVIAYRTRSNRKAILVNYCLGTNDDRRQEMSTTVNPPI